MTTEEPKQIVGFSFERAPSGKDEWITPPSIIAALSTQYDGEMFDLDPCSPETPPFPIAKNRFTERDNGLLKPWAGSVWCNPPYSTASKWLGRCKEHGDAIAMVFARTETRMFFEHVWSGANAIFFLRGRITFLNVAGTTPSYSAGTPSCLVAYGVKAMRRIAIASDRELIDGKLIYL